MEGIGRRRRGLLDLLRAIDGRAIYDDDDVDDDDGRDDEICALERDATRMLMHANRNVRRRGLFDSDPARASVCHVRALMTMSESSSNATNANAGGGGGEKKRRRNGGGGGGGGIHRGGGHGGGCPSASSYGIRLDSRFVVAPNDDDDVDRGRREDDDDDETDDASALLTAICRILGARVGEGGGGKERRPAHIIRAGGGENDDDDDDESNARGSRSRRSSDDDDDVVPVRQYSDVLVLSSLDVLRSICERARDEGTTDPKTSIPLGDGNDIVVVTCAYVEIDMLRSIGPYLLDALRDNVDRYSSIRRGGWDGPRDRRRRRNHHHRREDAVNDDDDYDVASRGLMSSLATCASLVSVLGTGISSRRRSYQGTMSALRDATWAVLLGEFDDGARPSGGVDDDDYDDDDIDDDDDGTVVGVRRAAIALLASLPLVGAHDDAGAANASSSSSSSSPSSSPSEVWSRSVRDGVSWMRWAIDDFFPVSTTTTTTKTGSGGEGGYGKGGVASSANDAPTSVPRRWEHVKWAAYARDGPSASAYASRGGDDVIDDGAIELDFVDPTDRRRSRSLLGRVRCLSMYLRSLLLMEGYPPEFYSYGIIMPLDSLLDVAEILLAFPLAAEARHRATKTRLRSTPVDGGLISPNGAMRISNRMRMCGHNLLDVILESCRGGCGVLGRARRVVGMVVANLKYSCSDALVRAVDGNGRRGGRRRDGFENGGGGGYGMASTRTGSVVVGSRRRGSIPLRTMSVATFHVAAVSLGCGVMSSTATSKSVSNALVLLGGCLLEQVRGVGFVVASGGGTMTVVDDEWGTLGERAKLV
jgi:hypothetical protein